MSARPVGPVLVTGARGNVGRHLVEILRVQGVPYSEAVRTPTASDASSVRFDFHDPTTWAAALADHRALFLVRPPAIADVGNNLNPFVKAAYEGGVEHVVFLSVIGAEKNRFVPHRKVEEHLQSLGDAYTNLRPGFFAQNLETAYRLDIVEDGRIYLPAGHAPVNWIDARDIAEAAARVLEAPDAHRGRSYPLTGPGAVPWSEVTDALSDALGRTIRYQPATVLGYVRHLRRRGVSLEATAVQTVLHYMLRYGRGATHDPTLECLLGRPPRTVRAYVEDCWAATPET